MLRLKEYRERAGLTQAQLAERAGVPRGTVSNMETSRTVPSWLAVVAVARALGLSLDELAKPSRRAKSARRGRPRKTIAAFRAAAKAARPKR